MRDERLIWIKCYNCESLRVVNKMLWDDGKTFKCNKCEKENFYKI